MEKSFGEILAEIRAERGISQKDMALRLKKFGVSVTNQAVSKWEKNATVPNALQFLAICELLGITDVMSAFQGKRPASPWAGLNRAGREKVREYIELLALSEKYRAPAFEPAAEIRTLPLYHIAASAGTGQFLDSGDYDMVEADDSVPPNANFGVKIAGDSMEPLFTNGQIVWVRQQQVLNTGEIGIFLYDGSAYCKKMERGDKLLRLISLNPQYPPIEVEKEADIRVLGKVVG